MKIKFFLGGIFFVTCNLFGSSSTVVKNPVEVRVVFSPSEEEGAVSFTSVPPQDYLYKKAIILYQKAVERNMFDVDGLERVTLIVDRQDNSVFLSYEYSDYSCGGMPLS